MRVLIIPEGEYDFRIRVIGDNELYESKIISVEQFKKRRHSGGLADEKHAVEIPLTEGFSHVFPHINS